MGLLLPAHISRLQKRNAHLKIKLEYIFMYIYLYIYSYQINFLDEHCVYVLIDESTKFIYFLRKLEGARASTGLCVDVSSEVGETGAG